MPVVAQAAEWPCQLPALGLCHGSDLVIEGCQLKQGVKVISGLPSSHALSLAS